MAIVTTPTTPTTLMEAVNTLLDTIGQSQISSLLTADLKEDAKKAVGVLGRASRDMQKRGWEFNTERGRTLLPNTDKHILLPTNCMSVLTVGEHRRVHVVQRGNRLYQPTKGTFEFDQSIKVDMVVLLEFDDLPEAARWYVACRAARVYANKQAFSPTAYQFSKEDEDRALIDLETYDAAMVDRSVAETNPHFKFMRGR